MSTTQLHLDICTRSSQTTSRLRYKQLTKQTPNHVDHPINRPRHSQLMNTQRYAKAQSHNILRASMMRNEAQQTASMTSFSLTLGQNPVCQNCRSETNHGRPMQACRAPRESRRCDRQRNQEPKTALPTTFSPDRSNPWGLTELGVINDETIKRET